MLLPSIIATRNSIAPYRIAVWIAAAACIALALFRYAEQPTFWLDEAFVAVSLRAPSLQSIFAPLEHGQLFPRIYLAAIAACRELFGYRILALRALPLLSFSVATLLWARLLVKRSQACPSLLLMSAALLIGSSYWLEQAIQLKQYTLDVAFALVPFIVSDQFFAEALGGRKRKAWLVALAAPCVFSYTYPMALTARVVGWYLYRLRGRAWRTGWPGLFALAAPVAVALVIIWWTDHRFNIVDRASYFVYWDECILRTRIEQGISSTLRLIAKFLWGWHGRQPLVTAGMAPLQILGVCYVLKRWRDHNSLVDDVQWGSRSLGSLVLLAVVLLASAAINYPICAGRVTLFTQVHTHILALEGALFVLTFPGKRKAALGLLYIFIAVLMFHSVRTYVRSATSEPAENLSPVVSLIDAEIANAVWVHPCSSAQVRSLPEPLPVERVIFGSEKKFPERGDKVWIVWSHMSGDACQTPMEQIRGQARSWQVIHEGPGRGLALAEF